MAAMQLPGPGVLLDHADELQLTGEQIARLGELDREATALREEAMALHARHRAALMEAIQAELPDRSAVRTHFDAAHAAMGQAHWLTMDAGLRAAAILTEEQRALAKTWAAAEPCCGVQQGAGAARQGKMCGAAAGGDGCPAGGRP
jgi:Spy/CpxP family protein refolding chaperone